jgi:hypothetical protein
VDRPGPSSAQVSVQRTDANLGHQAAPTLNYRFELFKVSHGVNFYPLTLTYLNSARPIKSEEEFKAKLKEIFAAPHTLNVVHSILAQVRS